MARCGGIDLFPFRSALICKREGKIIAINSRQLPHLENNSALHAAGNEARSSCSFQNITDEFITPRL